VEEMADLGKLYPGAEESMIAEAMSKEYKSKIITSKWKLPLGAFGENCGPS